MKISIPYGNIVIKSIMYILALSKWLEIFILACKLKVWPHTKSYIFLIDFGHYYIYFVLNSRKEVELHLQNNKRQYEHLVPFWIILGSLSSTSNYFVPSGQNLFKRYKIANHI